MVEEGLARFRAADEWIHPDCAIWVENVTPEAAKRGRILVLLADRFAQHIDFEMAGFLGEFIRRFVTALISLKRMQKANGEAAG
jgi:hypothetical protein